MRNVGGASTGSVNISEFKTVNHSRFFMLIGSSAVLI